ncbi:MAG: acetolactate synthase small subunit [Muribaculaceae bacterium]
MTNYNTLYTVTVFSENRVGIIHKLSIIYTRRKINIETISASPSSIKGISKITVTAYCSKDDIVKIVQQIENIIEVIKAFYYTDDEIVYQEIALYKVPTIKLLEEPNLESIIRKHNARILEITHEYTIVEKTGHYDETEALFYEFKKYGIRQFARSGRVAVTRSPLEYVTMYLDNEEKNRRPAEVWSSRE